MQVFNHSDRSCDLRRVRTYLGTRHATSELSLPIP